MKPIESTLPRVMKFEGDNRKMYNLSLHAQFHFLQYGLVKAADQAKLKIPAAVMTTWEAANKSETQLDQESTASEHTVVRGYRYSSEASKKEAALRLSAKLRPYTTLRNLPYEMESARIRGLEDDVSTMAADIAAVGLTSTFTELHTANEAYETLRMTRRTGSADTKLPTAQQVRALADEAYDIACQYIQAAYLYATANEDKTLIEQLVDRMNKVTTDLKTSHRQILAQKKAAKEPKQPKQPKEPKTPEPPKDPKQPEKPGGGSGEQPKKPDEQPKDPKKPDDGNPDITLPEE